MSELLEWIGSAITDGITAVIDFLLAAFNAVFQWFADTITAVLDWFVDLAAAAWAVFVSIYESILGWFKDTIEFLWDEAFDLIVIFIESATLWLRLELEEALDFLVQWLKDNDHWTHFDELKEGAASVANAYADAAWLLPLNECVLIFSITIITVATIRVGRWILKAASIGIVG